MKKYVVDVFRTYGTSIEVEADSEEDAENKAYKLAEDNTIDPASYELLEDIETECVGTVDENGERHYN